MQAVGHIPAVVDVLERRGRGKAVAAAAEAIPRALVHGTVHHHHFGHTGGHGHGSVHDRPAGSTAAVGYLGEELDVLAPQQPGDFIFRHFIHRVRAEALDLGRINTGVFQRSQSGLQRQTQFGAPGVFRKFGRAQANNGRAAGK